MIGLGSNGVLVMKHLPPLTPCRHRLFSFMEMRPADEEGSEEDFLASSVLTLCLSPSPADAFQADR